MTDILIRDVPEEVVAGLDAMAKRVGLSRTEFLRRTLACESTGRSEKVTVEDFKRFAETFADLKDPEVMKHAWRR